MRTVAAPLLIGVGGAAYLTGASTTSDSWEWGVTGLSPSSWAWQRTVGDWRARASSPFGGEPLDSVWTTDTPPTATDGFTAGTASAEQVTSLPAFRGPFDLDAQHARGKGGAVSVRSLGFLTPQTIPAGASDGRLRVEFAYHSGEGFVGTYAAQMGRSPQAPTFEPTAPDADSSRWTALSTVEASGLTTVTMEHRVVDPARELGFLSTGYLDDLVSWQAIDEPSVEDYRLRLTSVRMWGCFDIPSGLWRMRQRQSIAGTDSWPVRALQNGHHSGSWPIRARQNGI